MLYQDSDYNWAAFNRKRKVVFSEIECYISSPEDLVISKLMWYDISKSGKQLEGLKFLLTLENLDTQYLKLWSQKLYLNKYGLF